MLPEAVRVPPERERGAVRMVRAAPLCVGSGAGSASGAGRPDNGRFADGKKIVYLPS
nr:MAG TPA_asm: hypothetical protein [Caudoviricetes sp.]